MGLGLRWIITVHLADVEEAIPNPNPNPNPKPNPKAVHLADVEEEHPRAVGALLAQDLGGVAEHGARPLVHKPLRPRRQHGAVGWRERWVGDGPGPAEPRQHARRKGGI